MTAVSGDTPLSAESSPSALLPRVVGVPGAVLLGLGSILGTGVFVSIGLAASVAGVWLLPAVVLAGLLAGCNGLSSAQLAAAYPVSGGTYEYGHRVLSPTLGFAAGWMFLCAKSASAAAASLGFATYALSLLAGSASADASSPPALRAVADAAGVSAAGTSRIAVVVAVLTVLAMTVLVAGGMRRSQRANAVVVACTLGALGLFVVVGTWSALGPAAPSGATRAVDALAGAGGRRGLASGIAALSSAPFDGRAFLHATALLFVAYTGYGRIATLGEEVRDPARSIPRAIVLTLVVSVVLYFAVAAVSLAVVGAPTLADSIGRGAPLSAVASAFAPAIGTRAAGVVRVVVAVGAVTAMLGVLLNLLLGLSRVLLAMARRGDAPRSLAVVAAARAGRDADASSPRRAVFVIGVVIAVLAGTGRLGTTWSFSAFTVLVYYAITNLAALRLPAADRRQPRVVAVAGLVGCLGLACFVERAVWLGGLSVLGVGLLGRLLVRATRGVRQSS